MDSSSSPAQDNIDRDAHDFDDQGEFTTPESNQRRKRKEALRIGDTADDSKSPRILSTRSDVWNHFTRVEKIRDKCFCNYCQKQFACSTKSGTTNLRNHLNICKQHKAWLDSQDVTQSQKVINHEGHLQSARVSESVFREAANEMLVIGELPLSFIESMTFKHFCNKVNLYKPHSRRTASRDIVQMFVQRKAALREWFITSKQRVSLTSDIWVSQITGASYMVLTAHYIDAYWRLKKLIIGFKYVTDHKGKTIANVLLECLAEWGIERVFCVTVDNATANSSALLKFESTFSLIANDSLVMNGEFMHMRCAGHIINLIVRDGLEEVDESVTAVRNAIYYVISGPKRQSAFEQKVESGRMTRGSLPLDVKTRWNSTYLMLTRAIKYRAAFDKMETEDKLYNDHFLEFDDGRKRIGPPSLANWRAVERLVRFLIIFYNSTLVVSASTTLNAHKCYGEIVNIASNLRLLCSNCESDMKEKAEKMFRKFEKYWDGFRNINKMLVVASVFDPRKKMQFAKMCFEELYGEGSTESKELYGSIFTLLVDMYKEYGERYGQNAELQQSQPASSSQCTQDQQTDSMDFDDDELGYQSHRIEKRYNNLLKEIGVRNSNELDSYLKDKVENPEVMMGIEYDVLSWWKINSGKYLILSMMARDLFAMQVSSVASESAYSTSGRIIDPYRSCLSHYMVEVLMCTEQWMKQDIRCEERVLTNAQLLAELDFELEFEKEFQTLAEQ